MKKIVPVEKVSGLLSDEFGALEIKHGVQLTERARQNIIFEITWMASASPWDDTEKKLARREAIKSLLPLTAKMKKIVTVKIMKQGFEWDEDGRFLDLIGEIETLVNQEVRIAKNKTGRPRHERERKMLRTLFKVYADGGGRGKGVTYDFYKEDKEDRVRSKFIDFVLDLCRIEVVPVSETGG